MYKNFSKTVATIALSAVAFVPVGAGITLVSADAAYANNGNGNGNGGGANGAEAGGNRGQDNKAAREEIMETAGAKNWGVIASELGELNKANANVNARLNSSDPVHQALGAYELSGGITAEGVAVYNSVKDDFTTYSGSLVIGATITDPQTNTDVVLTAENISNFSYTFDQFATFAGLSSDLITAYEALAVLQGFRDDPLTAGAIDALNYMLGLEDPATGAEEPAA
ncbi:hypothetical protein GCM10011517_20440 [Actibacterium pelagium]|uniref:Uncharacterized protein n=2 Tax=Actibacterium pelagium TaxID=2029103 RepID=A0A917EJV5_9RHOB|nr:hypothetical protein [Actibacterium pelagium]GGE52598.1 hypothetical protein GCM10011517_20440 [Actibacterium pelagium]